MSGGVKLVSKCFLDIHPQIATPSLSSSVQQDGHQVSEDNLCFIKSDS
jgi:hypothetical protein